MGRLRFRQPSEPLRVKWAAAVRPANRRPRPLASLERGDRCRVLITGLQSTCAAREGLSSPIHCRPCTLVCREVPTHREERDLLNAWHLSNGATSAACWSRISRARVRGVERSRRASRCLGRSSWVLTESCACCATCSTGALRTLRPPPEAEQLLPHWIAVLLLLQRWNHVNWKRAVLWHHCRTRSVRCGAAAAWAP